MTPPVPSNATLRLAEESLTAGQMDQAWSLFQSLLSTDATCVQATMGLGVIAAGRGQLDLAADHFDHATHLSPESALAHYNLGLVLKSLNRLDDSVRHLETALLLDQDNAAICSMLGNALAALGRVHPAEARYRHALELDPDYAQAWYNLGVLLQTKGSQTEAVRCYERVVELDAGFTQAWTNLGTIRQTEGKDADAILCFQQALAAKPDCADAMVDLGLTLFRLGIGDDAKLCAETADQLAVGPNFPHYSLGLLFAKLGQAEAARRHLTQSLHVDPADTQGAGLILAALGATPLPARSTDAQIKRLYDMRAATWDVGAGSDGAYQGHVLVADLFAAVYADATELDVLDAGCGTGLVGDRLIGLHPHSLQGVDLSQSMLDVAQDRGIYTSLHHEELVAFMTRHPSCFDVAVSAATLIHFGDLSPVFAAAATCLRAGGRLMFTIFKSEDADVALSFDQGHAEGGCYLHSRGHVERAATAAGFAVETIREAIHEYDRGRPVGAMVVGLVK